MNGKLSVAMCILVVAAVLAGLPARSRAAATADAGPILGVLLRVGAVSDGPSAYIAQLAASKLANTLLRSGMLVYWLADPVEYAGRLHPRGSLWVPLQAEEVVIGGMRLEPATAGAVVARLADSYGTDYTVVQGGSGRRMGWAEQVNRAERSVGSAKAFRLGPARVAVYQGDRTYSGSADVMSSLEYVGVYPDYVTASEIRQGALAGYDVLIMPGGAQDVQSYALGPMGKARIRSFVEAGGHYIGICAGAYLASDQAYGLNLVSASSRGRGTVGSYMSIVERPGGHPLFWGYPSTLDGLYYGGGPNFVADERGLAFVNEIPESWKNKALAGAAAIIEDAYGAGRVLLIGPHPENSRGPEGVYGMPRLFGNAMLWIARSEAETVELGVSAVSIEGGEGATGESAVGATGTAGAITADRVTKGAGSFRTDVDSLSAVIDSITRSVNKTAKITSSLDGKTSRSEFFWNFCYFGWTMKEPARRIRELPGKLSQLADEYERMEQAAADEEGDSGPIRECMSSLHTELEAVRSDLDVLEPLWDKVARDMAIIEADVDMLLARGANGNPQAGAGASQSDLDWWRLNIREYLVAVELVGGLNWKYWASENSMEETARTGHDELTGDPVQVVAASTLRGGIGILTMQAARLNRALEASSAALAVHESIHRIGGMRAAF